MQRQWLARTGTSDLILVFAGWALGAAPFAGLVGEEDVLLVQDYTTLDAVPGLAGYDRVSLLAYSFGAVSAAHWLAQTGAQVQRRVAVAGTLYPADADKGIAPETVRLTAESLTSASFAKFCRRAGLDGPAPNIDIDAARDELLAIADRGPAPDPGFDRVWIPARDRIIPTRAQKLAWAGHAGLREVDGGHVPFRPGQRWEGWFA
ncbi:pimeloyl-ACP methyl esterase BioG family protein [Aliiroseovarius sp.]|uniref:pimeloyl-ACP methyl esterase BioG family protein n=1 Tax=Aliiroseovarius sp. TaxID=1872442 RepID=UPI002634BCCE|nr:pimeloyl-ACP methyl esterase BioG family protein [Aliiroseovarius sp.]